MKKFLFAALLVVSVFVYTLQSCKNGPDKEKAPAKTTEITPRVVQPVKNPPIINITDSVTTKRIVLCIRDSAATQERISLKLAAIYGNKLSAAIRKHNLKVTGAPMAWYSGNKAPFFFTAGIPVDKKISKKIPGTEWKETGTDSMVVAHFYGPYALLPQAYEALENWVKERKKTPVGKPYEIYIGDPLEKDGKPKDPYKVLTDVVYPWK